ncbi:MAG: phosphoribosyl-AMP cyclohydrolase [Sneathiella sp.]
MNEKLTSLIKFNEAGLIPAIAQQHDTGEILMMAWMNSDAIDETLKTGQICYWSRSRQSLWRKGESSGHVQTLVDFRLDCDGDTILLLVKQKGVACHTGRHNCFFYSANDADVKIISEVEVSPEEMYNKK